MRNAALAALLFATAACTTRPRGAARDAAMPAAHGYDLAAQRAKTRGSDDPDTAFLNAEEREW